MKHPKRPAAFNLLMLTLAGMINAVGITLFLSPVKLYDSGISGTSMLLEQITPPYLSLSVFLLLLNIPLFLFGLKKQGRLFTVYAIYTVLIYSLFAWLITDVFPVDVSIASPLAGTDLLLCAAALSPASAAALRSATAARWTASRSWPSSLPSALALRSAPS